MTVRCLHPRVTLQPGDPPSEPYYVCDKCGRQLSDAEFDLAMSRTIVWGKKRK